MPKRSDKYPLAVKRLRKEILRERFVPKKTTEQSRPASESPREPVNQPSTELNTAAV